MTEPKFKIGDEILVSGFLMPSAGDKPYQYANNTKVVILTLPEKKGSMCIELNEEKYCCHVKQTRRIKKRREIWAYEHPVQGLWLTCTSEKELQTSRVEKSGGKVIRFLEAKEK